MFHHAPPLVEGCAVGDGAVGDEGDEMAAIIPWLNFLASFLQRLLLLPADTAKFGCGWVDELRRQPAIYSRYNTALTPEDSKRFNTAFTLAEPRKKNSAHWVGLELTTSSLLDWRTTNSSTNAHIGELFLWHIFTWLTCDRSRVHATANTEVQLNFMRGASPQNDLPAYWRHAQCSIGRIEPKAYKRTNCTRRNAPSSTALVPWGLRPLRHKWHQNKLLTNCLVRIPTLAGLDVWTLELLHVKLHKAVFEDSFDFMYFLPALRCVGVWCYFGPSCHQNKLLTKCHVKSRTPALIGLTQVWESNFRNNELLFVLVRLFFVNNTNYIYYPCRKLINENNLVITTNLGHFWSFL